PAVPPPTAPDRRRRSPSAHAAHGRSPPRVPPRPPDVSDETLQRRRPGSQLPHSVNRVGPGRTAAPSAPRRAPQRDRATTPTRSFGRRQRTAASPRRRLLRSVHAGLAAGGGDRCTRRRVRGPTCPAPGGANVAGSGL